MTTGQTVSEYVKLARDAIHAGDFTAAETYTAQAKALKGLDDLTPHVDTTKQPKFDAGGKDEDALEKSAKDAAMKAWYTKSVGGNDIDGDIETVLGEMYGGSYRHLRYAKAADFVRFIRTGNCDPRLKKLVVYTPEQVMAELVGGMSVADLKSAQKATQVESQDTSGERTLAA